MEDTARTVGVAPSYVSRVLRLTLLGPDILEAILDGRQPAELQLDDLLRKLFCWAVGAVVRCERKAEASASRCYDGGRSGASVFTRRDLGELELLYCTVSQCKVRPR